MDLAIEANRNSALFNTMQQVLDVYNPLLHKARPTVVNETKQRIRTPANQWANSFDRWNGRRTARFDMPRIGTLADVSLKCAFRIPGQEPTDAERATVGDRGYAKTSLTTGGLVNTNTTANTARGRLDRVYADRLLGFNMIRSYVVSSKSREIFRATGEYLLLRFSQMDDTMKDAVFRATTPVDVMASTCEDMYYAPFITYQMSIPLFLFFNEHITNALDVNFSEEVHIDIEFRSPSELFYYGNLGDLARVSAITATGETGQLQQESKTLGTGSVGLQCWDQSTTGGSTIDVAGVNTNITVRQVNTTGAAAAQGSARFGTANMALNVNDDDVFVYATDDVVGAANSQAVTSTQMRHIQGTQAPWDGTATGTQGTNGWVGTTGFYGAAGYVHSGTTFAFPDVDNNGESCMIQLEMNCDYIIQDTDAYRALRAQTFPEGTGFTSIVYNTSQEVFSNLMASAQLSQNLLDVRSGGQFTDPDQSSSGITVGDSTRFVDLPLRDNHLAFATSFMVRKMSDLGGDGTTAASSTSAVYGKTVTSKTLGAHQIYSRALPVHYFQLMSAGRIIYESDGRTQLALTQSAMYNGTGKDWGIQGSDLSNTTAPNGFDTERINGRPFNIYTINFGLGASRLENTGSLSYQNLNNPTLRIFLKPDTWGEHQVQSDTNGTSEAKSAAAFGVQVDVIHEHFNVITVNSGNGEITSGLNQ